jgi:hypothetical protein
MKVLRLAAILVVSVLAFSQSGEIAPNENLVAQGIPKIPRAGIRLGGRC